MPIKTANLLIRSVNLPIKTANSLIDFHIFQVYNLGRKKRE